MKRAIRALVGVWLFGLGMLMSVGAQADVTSVSASPSQRNVALGTSTAFTLTWTVVRDNGNAGPTVTSTQGSFQSAAGDVVYGTVPTTLTQSQPIPPPTTASIPTTFTFRESLRVPTDVIYRAYKSGATRIYYVRTFTDSVTALPGQVVLDITGSSAAGFSLTRLSLRFDDDTALRVVGQGTKLGAYAEVSYTGTGQLQAAWEIAEPPSTQGQPVYRTLQLVRRVLAGGDRVRIPAPALPTDAPGFYLLRLRVTEPKLPVSDDELPFIRYVVARESARARPPQTLSVNTPASGALLSKGTDFTWQAVDGARAYQLELYAKGPFSVADTLPSLGGDGGGEGGVPAGWRPSGPPTAGVLVPGDRTRAMLSALGDTHLKSGYVYRWRVLAIGESGETIAVSPWREVRTP
ncbi:MAG TPA: hypothetical protein VKA50_15360 [Gammaproteobacteria bacterium]|nr:hypothetical protein [Gammaproteobacteria bacterium]